MTTARPAVPPAGTRQQRRLERRRLVREECVAVLVLLVVLLVTVLLLGLQWLDSGSSSSLGALGPGPVPYTHTLTTMEVRR